MVTVSYVTERIDGDEREGGGNRGEGCPPSFCVSEPQNACFPILVPDGALLAVVWTPERGKQSSGRAESIYGSMK